MRMRINNLRNLIVSAWSEAEAQLRQDPIQMQDRDEEFITGLFSGYLRSEFETATRIGGVEQAFRKDLAEAFPDLDFYYEHQIWRGLIATVTFHPKHVEARTGGDFGLVVVRPEVTHEWQKLRIEDGHRRGLICQAKIFQRATKHRRKPGYGPLSSNEMKVLNSKLDYLALLLYRYEDSARETLAPFEWKIASGATIENIQSWLVHNCIPDKLDSPRALRALIDEKIGTADEKLIDEDISPKVRPSLTITISWKDGDYPGNVVHLAKHQAHVHVLQSR